MAFDLTSSDYYERLGVDASASSDEIRRAFRRIARQTHPDRNPDDPRAAERFRRVREAYAVLSDPDERAEYDAERRAASTSSRRSASDASAITATSVSQTGCVTYYLPRVAIGLLACGAFFLLEAFDVWQSDDMQAVALWVTGASVVTGALSVLVFWLFPDVSDDYAVRFGRDDVRVWSESRMVAQVPWGAVRNVDANWPRGIVRLGVTASVADRVVPTPPFLTVDRSGADGPVLRLYLNGTDVNLARLQRFLETIRDGATSTT